MYTDGGMDKQTEYIYAMEYYSATKRKHRCAIPWMNLINISSVKEAKHRRLGAQDSIYMNHPRSREGNECLSGM